MKFLKALVMAGVSCAAAQAQDDITRYEGIAHSREGRLLYRESHWLHGTAPQRELLVLFYCPDGRPFARKQVLEAGHPLAPSFALDDARFGYREGVRPRDTGGREIYVRRRANDDEKRMPLVDVEGLVIDAGIDAYIQANWQALIGGEARRMPFVVPSRLRSYEFIITRTGGAAPPDAAEHRFRLELDAWYAFAIDPIDMIYSSESRRLLGYSGIANVRSDSGASLRADISFPEEMRRRADPSERSQALVATLDGRCVL